MHLVFMTTFLGQMALSLVRGASFGELRQISGSPLLPPLRTIKHYFYLMFLRVCVTKLQHLSAKTLTAAAGFLANLWRPPLIQHR